LVDTVEDSGDVDITPDTYESLVVLGLLDGSHPFDFLLTLRKLIHYSSAFKPMKTNEENDSGWHSLKKKVAKSRGLPVAKVGLKPPLVKARQVKLTGQQEARATALHSVLDFPSLAENGLGEDGRAIKHLVGLPHGEDLVGEPANPNPNSNPNPNHNPNPN